MSPVAPSEGGFTTLLIDFDGTLADTLGYLREVYRRFVREHEGRPSEAEFQSLNGPPIAEVVRRLCQTYRIAASVEDRIRYYNVLIDESFSASAIAEGAQELIAAARTRGMTSWIVTSNGRARVTRWLEAKGLADRCAVIVGAEDEVEGKPSPAPYLLALSKLGIGPDDAVAVEDSASGTLAALRAGLATIKLGQPLRERQARLHVVTDLLAAASLIERGLR